MPNDWELMNRDGLSPSKTPRAAYEEYLANFKTRSDQELIDAFNREVGNIGWTSSRGSYLAALHDEFDCRGFDYSAIGNMNSLSLRSRIKLSDKKVEALDKSKTGGPSILRVHREE